MFRHQTSGIFTIFCNGIFLALTSLGLTEASVSQKIDVTPEGVAWLVRGSWLVGGKQVHLGDAVSPGALLQPSAIAGSQSIELLLPDGQRVIYECYTVDDCARGFRVPPLFAVVDPFAVEFLTDVRQILSAHRKDAPEIEPGGPPVPRLPHDESVAVLDKENRVQIRGLAEKLPNGHYTCNLRSLDSSQPPTFHIGVQKDSPFLTVTVPSAGIYDITVRDDLDMPRVDLFVAAIKTEQTQRIDQAYRKAGKLMAGWNENYTSWPTHDLQRAYLEWLVLDPKALNASRALDTPDHAGGVQSGGATQSPQSLAGQPGLSRTLDATAEPKYSPKPGPRPGATEVSLRSETAGATIHYTVDGSQPTASSAEYEAPIVIKSSELTIKAFASATGKKDSAVVTGNFIVKDEHD